jgi:hypothetical protein
MKTFWKTLRRINRPQTSPFPDFLMVDETIVTNPTKILEHITSFYHSLSTNLDKEAQTFFNQSKPDNTQQLNLKRKLEQFMRIESKSLHHTTMNNKLRESLKHNMPITLEEIQVILKTKFKPNKAPGPDSLPAECFKHSDPILLKLLLILYNGCFSLAFTPSTWQHTSTKLLHKGGDHNIIKNYRPITLLNVLFKTWERVLETRLRKATETNISPLQQGSRKHRTTTDTILAARLLDEHHTRNPKTHIYTAQIDLSKAYNRVNRDHLWHTISERMNIKGRLWHCLKSTYSSYTDTICIGNRKSQRTQMKNGLRQGSALSPLLFIIYINPLIEKLLESGTGLDMPNFPPHNKIPCFMFVDDLILKAPSLRELEKQIDIVKQYGNDTGCIVNLDITKGISVSSTSRSKSLDTYCENHELPIKKTLTYTYLGAGHKPTSASNSEHINLILSKTNKKLSFMKSRGLQYGHINKANSKKIIEAILIPSLTYAMEAQNLSKEEYNRLNHFISKALVITHNAPVFQLQHNNIIEKPKPSPVDIWNMFEADILPPSILIERSKFKLFYNVTMSSQNTILKHILNVIPNNSFLVELTRIQSEWQSTTILQSIQNNTKKSTFEKALKEDMVKAAEGLLYTQLPVHWTHNSITEGILPSIYPGTNPKALQYRAHHLFKTQDHICLMCNMQTPPTVYHILLQCPYPLRETKRSFFWSELKSYDRESANLLMSLPPYHQLLLILNLIQSDNDKMQRAILQSDHYLFDIV